MPKRDLYSRLVYARQHPIMGSFSYYFLKMLGIEIPKSVKIGSDFILVHGGFGVVIHPDTDIGNRVKIYPGVTIGRADIHRSIRFSEFQGVHIEDDVILSSGAKILCKKGVLNIGRGTVIGANAVLLESTGENEIWGGIPAKKIGVRELDEESG